MDDTKSHRRELPWSIEQRARERVSRSHPDLSRLSLQEVNDLVFQLRIHQEELQIMNEDLVLAQKNLAHTKERYIDLYEFAPIGYLTLDSDHIIHQTNLTAAAMFDRPRRELLGRKFSSLVTGEDRGKCFIHLRSSLQSNPPSSAEITFLRNDGTAFVASTQVTQIETLDGTFEWRVVLSDISERKQLEQKLAGERELLETIIDTIPVMITIYEPEVDRVVVNKAFEEITGWGQDDVNTTAIMERLYPDPDYRKEILDFMQSLAPCWKDVRLVCKTGVAIETSWSSVQIPDGRRIGIGIDIHERKQMEHDLRRHASALEAANRELESFSYSVSHDLRAPLHSMRAFSDALMQDYTDQLDDLGQEYLSRIDKAADRMVALIDDMLKLAGVTQREMETEPVDIGKIAQAFVDELCATNRRRNVLVVIHENLVATADRHLISIALRNLLRNAWKYTGQRSDPRIEIGKVQTADQPTFYIKDNGVGFDPNLAEKLFVPFQRLHSDKIFPGTGIGLPIVQRVILRHGGKVWAESSPGQGATFFFTLPQ